MNNLRISFYCVLPLFIEMTIGYLIKSTKLIEEKTFSSMSRVCFYVLLPVSVFYNIYNSNITSEFPSKIMIFLIIVVCGLVILGFLLSNIFKYNRSYAPIFTQNLYRTNIGIVGITLAESVNGDECSSLMAVVLAILVPLYNLLAVLIFELYSDIKINILNILIRIIKNPFIIAGIIGCIFNLTNINIPSVVVDTSKSLGNTGSIMALISLGGTFEFSGLQKNAKRIIFNVIIRLILVPLLTIIVAVQVGFNINEMAVIMICISSAVATNMYTMAVEYKSDYELSGQLVVVTSVISCFTMFIFIFILKEMGLI